MKAVAPSSCPPTNPEEGSRGSLGEGPLIAVVGVTASGKSRLALEIAERFGGEILNADAMQVFRYLDIGTAKPSADDQARIPHHLIDLIDPDESYSAARYLADGSRAIAGIRSRGHVPIMCGGTGLYFKALLRGIAPVPAVPAAVRGAVREMAQREGLAACYAELVRVDPHAAQRIHAHDNSRILRALEVFRATGRPLTEFQQQVPFGKPPANLLCVGMQWQREELRARITGRVEAMLAAGWIGEVERIRGMGYPLTLKPLQAIGYREIGELLAGRLPRAELAPLIATKTRQYAKRQGTWFRNQQGPGGDEVLWCPPGEEATIIRRVGRYLDGQA